MSIAPSEIYRSMMLEIKIRLREVDQILKENEIPNLQVEFFFLQFRKIIEKISFASVVCDHQRYKDFRELEGLTSDRNDGDYTKDWNATVILKTLNDVNPLFMPRPIGKINSNDGIHHIEGTDVNATHKKLISMYKKCNGFLHIPKPFGQDYVTHIEKQREKYRSSRNTIESYLSYFKDLMWHHAAIGLEYLPATDKLNSVDLASPKSAWLVNFGEPNNNSIEVIVGFAELIINKALQVPFCTRLSAR